MNFNLQMNFVLIENRYFVDYDCERMHKVDLVKQFDELFDDLTTFEENF